MFEDGMISYAKHLAKIAQPRLSRFVRNKSSLSSPLKMINHLQLLLLVVLFGTTSCALLRKKDKDASIKEIPMESILKYLSDPKPDPVLLILEPEAAFTQRMLDYGYNLVQVIDEEQQAEFRSPFAEYPDVRLRLSSFMQGKIGEDMDYSGILMDEGRLGRPIGINQNREMIQLLWTRLAKDATLFYFHYNSEAAIYGKKTSSFKPEEIIDLVRFKFNQIQTDSTSIPGIHVIKFTK